MKRMKLISPGKVLGKSQHCRCSWCQNGVDPFREGVCFTCHGKLKSLLTSQKWRLLRQSYLDTLETGQCQGFIVSALPSPAIPLAPPCHSPYLATASIATPLLLLDRSIALAPLSSLPFQYHPCHSIGIAPAVRIDHILPWNYYPSLFWHSENHQQLCLDCNARKTQLDGSHKTDNRHSI